MSKRFFEINLTYLPYYRYPDHYRYMKQVTSTRVNDYDDYKPKSRHLYNVHNDTWFEYGYSQFGTKCWKDCYKKRKQYE